MNKIIEAILAALQYIGHIIMYIFGIEATIETAITLGTIILVAIAVIIAILIIARFLYNRTQYPPKK